MTIRYTGDNPFMQKYAKLLPDGFVDSNFVTAPHPNFSGEDWWVRSCDRYAQQMAWKDQEYKEDWDKQKYVPLQLHKYDVRIEGPDAERLLDMLAYSRAVANQTIHWYKDQSDVRLEKR